MVLERGIDRSGGVVTDHEVEEAEALSPPSSTTLKRQLKGPTDFELSDSSSEGIWSLKKRSKSDSKICSPLWQATNAWNCNAVESDSLSRSSGSASLQLSNSSISTDSSLHLSEPGSFDYSQQQASEQDLFSSFTCKRTADHRQSALNSFGSPINRLLSYEAMLLRCSLSQSTKIRAQFVAHVMLHRPKSADSPFLSAESTNHSNFSMMSFRVPFQASPILMGERHDSSPWTGTIRLPKRVRLSSHRTTSLQVLIQTAASDNESDGSIVHTFCMDLPNLHDQCLQQHNGSAFSAIVIRKNSLANQANRVLHSTLRFKCTGSVTRMPEQMSVLDANGNELDQRGNLIPRPIAPSSSLATVNMEREIRVVFPLSSHLRLQSPKDCSASSSTSLPISGPFSPLDLLRMDPPETVVLSAPAISEAVHVAEDKLRRGSISGLVRH